MEGGRISRLIATNPTCLISRPVVRTTVELRAGERVLKAVELLQVLVAERYPLVVDVNSQAALSMLKRYVNVRYHKNSLVG